MGSTRTVSVQIPVERQKAAQAAGHVELVELPGRLATPAAAVRVGKTSAADKTLINARALTSLTKISPRQVLVNYGKSEARWATAYQRRRSGGADFMQLLSYARQIIAVTDDGDVVICLMGHAGHGPCVPLWVPQPDVVLTLQPNDLVMRFEDMTIDQ